jgi:ADP-ribose pyrophosphatase YjhB (NUDIX family)
MTERHMLSFVMGARRFNYRVAAVVVRDNHVLVCREDDDDYVMLPGGRVELGERSDVALAREIAEEMAVPGAVGRLVFTSESFYGRDDEGFHELSLFYAADVPDFPGPGGGDPVLVREDEGHVLQFSWVALEPAVLRARRLLPDWLCDRLAALPDAIEHVIVDELGA